MYVLKYIFEVFANKITKNRLLRKIIKYNANLVLKLVNGFLKWGYVVKWVLRRFIASNFTFSQHFAK